jgi:hypothetical protein
MTTTTHRIDRRTFTATAISAGIAAGLFATPLLRVSAQEATPIVTVSGYVSTRLRTVTSAEARDQVNATVLDQFVDQVKALEGYDGYLLGDVIDEPTLSLAIVALEESSQGPAFDEAAKEFVASISDLVDAEKTLTWVGDVLILGSPIDNGTPMATPVIADTSGSSGYVAVRIHTSKPDTDPRDIVPAIISGFLPIVTGLAGFKGYLWYPIDGGFVAISLFDSVESATASNEAAKEWAVENVSTYTDGNPQIINADVVYADLPILG